jgi:hypothetical protein
MISPTTVRSRSRSRIRSWYHEIHGSDNASLEQSAVDASFHGVHQRNDQNKTMDVMNGKKNKCCQG